MDWFFVVDFSNPSNSMKPLGPGDAECLAEIALFAAAMRDHANWTEESWAALVAGLRHGRELGIPDFRLEEASGLRGKFMLDLIAGKVNLENLISKPLPNR